MNCHYFLFLDTMLRLFHRWMWTTRGLLLHDYCRFIAVQMCPNSNTPPDHFWRRHLYLWITNRHGLCRRRTIYFPVKWFGCLLLLLIWLGWDRKQESRKRWKDAEQQIDSALPMVFMMDRRAELSCGGFTILCGFEDPILLIWTNLTSSWYERGISWNGDKSSVGVCIHSFLEESGLKKEWNQTLWTAVFNIVVPYDDQKDRSKRVSRCTSTMERLVKKLRQRICWPEKGAQRLPGATSSNMRRIGILYISFWI